MIALRQNPAVLHVQDAVGADHRREPVRDQNDGPVFADAVDRLLDLRLRHVVKRRGRLIKEDDAVILTDYYGI